ncbi:hypothetical protein BAMBUS_01570 [Brevundimonas phage vB_BpoS-Bambus]|nr:hypothetical protein BAMBUS_01570 [Brevundimonas phage vB_BpoS-Bambus]
MLRLSPPSRRAHDVAISIRGTATRAIVRDVVQGFGCPAPTAKRVHACLRASQRYDCRVAQAAVNNGLADYAARHGLSVIVHDGA